MEQTLHKKGEKKKKGGLEHLERNYLKESLLSKLIPLGLDWNLSKMS